MCETLATIIDNFFSLSLISIKMSHYLSNKQLLSVETSNGLFFEYAFMLIMLIAILE